MSSEIKSFKDLAIWKRARVLMKHGYELSNRFPAEERFGLTSQMRRAAVSIISKIAEGHARPGRNDFVQFLSISIGSSAELETQLILAQDLAYTAGEQIQPLIMEIDSLQKMMHKLRQSLLK